MTGFAPWKDEENPLFVFSPVEKPIVRRSRSASRIFLFWLLELSQSHSIPHSARARVRLNTSASAYACRMSYVACRMCSRSFPSARTKRADTDSPKFHTIGTYTSRVLEYDRRYM